LYAQVLVSLITLFALMFLLITLAYRALQELGIIKRGYIHKRFGLKRLADVEMEARTPASSFEMTFPKDSSATPPDSNRQLSIDNSQRSLQLDKAVLSSSAIEEGMLPKPKKEPGEGNLDEETWVG